MFFNKLEAPGGLGLIYKINILVPASGTAPRI
jgi:hypothetical protein